MIIVLCLIWIIQFVFDCWIMLDLIFAGWWYAGMQRRKEQNPHSRPIKKHIPRIYFFTDPFAGFAFVPARADSQKLFCANCKRVLRAGVLRGLLELLLAWPRREKRDAWQWLMNAWAAVTENNALYMSCMDWFATPINSPGQAYNQTLSFHISLARHENSSIDVHTRHPWNSRHEGEDVNI